MLSLSKYFGVSSLAAAAVIYHAFSTREQFFPSTYYLATSKVAVAVMANMAFSWALVFYNVMTKVFLGTLRESEVERINERISQAIMETCLAMTIFREEFNMSFVAMFTILTFIKVYHWLLQDRVDYIETTPAVSRLHHVRIVAFMGVLLGVDAAFLQYTVSRTLAHSASVHLLFAFEYVIQASIVTSTFCKYALSMVDAYMEGRWENKGVWVFYLELLTDMLHLCVYLVFFIIVFSNYGLPLHLVRDLYWTFRNFRNRVADFLRYRRVTANMDERFAEASAEDLARCDGICIICREEMPAGARNKKLPCSHVFHMHCLRSWLERQQSCPTCRTSVFTSQPDAQSGQQAAQGGHPAPQPAAGGQQQGPAGGQQPNEQQQPNMRNQHVPPQYLQQQAQQLLYHQAHQQHMLQQLQQQQLLQQQLQHQQQQLQQQQAQQAQQSRPMQGGASAAATSAAAGTSSTAQPSSSSQAPRQQQPAAQGGSARQQAAAAAAQAAYAAATNSYSYMWNAPQFAVPTSMQVFVPAVQYAGQQSPDFQPGSQGMASFPVLPLVLPPAIPTLIPTNPSATPEQQHQQAVAAMAAMPTHLVSPYTSMMLPPSVLAPGAPASMPPGAGYSAPYSVGVPGTPGQAGASQSPALGSSEAVEAALTRHMDVLQQHVSRLRQARQQYAAERAEAPPSAAGPSTSQPESVQQPGATQDAP